MCRSYINKCEQKKNKSRTVLNGSQLAKLKKYIPYTSLP